jgi:hypothetical protein
MLQSSLSDWTHQLGIYPLTHEPFGGTLHTQMMTPLKVELGPDFNLLAYLNEFNIGGHKPNEGIRIGTLKELASGFMF